MATTIGSFDLASLKNLRDDVTQYFWFESDSSSAWGSGAHVTLYPESQFTDSTSPNYMKGQNIIMNTDGFSIRNGGLPMMVLDNDSLDFNIVDTNLGTYTTMATFGLSGMRTYSRDSANNLVQLANIGYGEGQADTGTAIAPYYTLGTRASNSIIGNYSMAEGYNTTASGAYSHAEGFYTIASGNYSHAEGIYTVANIAYSHAEGHDTIASGESSHAEGHNATASGLCSHAGGYHTTASGANSHAEGYYTTASGANSHAEGYYTTASGRNSHAEGYNTTASGYYSHAGGRYTIAQRQSQTIIGEHNIADTGGTDETTRGDYAFIIGNGDIDTQSLIIHKSNALTVDWDGNVKTHNDQYTLVAVESGTDNGWTYRKYADGRIELEKDVTTSSTWSAIGSAGIYYNVTNITVPSGVSVTSGYANINFASNYIVGTHIQIDSSNIRLELHRLASSSASFSVHVTLIGTYS